MDQDIHGLIIERGEKNIRERLDWFLCNLAWRTMFEHAEVHHLPRSHSDHHPILVACEKDRLVSVGPGSFLFQAAGLQHWFPVVFTRAVASL